MGQDPGSLICGRALGKCPRKSKACKSWVQNIQVWRRAKKQSVGLNLNVCPHLLAKGRLLYQLLTLLADPSLEVTP